MLLTGPILLIFAIGYVAMSRHIKRVGGLYLFVTEGLGKVAGLGIAFVAVGAYAAAATGAVGAFAVFAQIAVADIFRVDSGWVIWALIAVAAMAILGLLKVELNARVLGVFIVAEILVLLIVGFSITLQGGSNGLSVSGFTLGDFAKSNPGVLLALSIAAFAGFEATALFAEEASDRVRTVRRATFAAIIVMALLYTFITWALTQAFGGAAGAVGAAAKDPSGMFYAAAHSFVGGPIVTVMEVLVVTSWFASILAFHNATARYLLALGRDRALPRMFASVGRRFKAPWFASLTHSAFTLIVVIAVAIAGLDPFTKLFILGSTPASIALPFMEAVTAFAILAFFARDRRGFPAWQVIIAPAVAGVLLTGIAVLFCFQVGLLTGEGADVNSILIGVVVGAFIIGIARAFWMRWRKPADYAQLGQSDPTD